MVKDTAPVKPSCQVPIPLNTLDVVALSLVDKAEAKDNMSDKISKGNFFSTGRMLTSYVDSYCGKINALDIKCSGSAERTKFIQSIAGANEDDNYKPGYDSKKDQYPVRPYVRGVNKPEAVLPLYFVKVTTKDVVTADKTTIKQDVPDTSTREPLKYGQSYYLVVKKIDAKPLLTDSEFDGFIKNNMSDDDGLLYLSITPDNSLVWSCVPEQIAKWTISLDESVLSRKGSAFQSGKEKEDYPEFAAAYKDYVMAGDLFSLAPTKSGLEKYVFSSKTYTVSLDGKKVNAINITSDTKLASSLAAFIYKSADPTDKKSVASVVYDETLDLPGKPDEKKSIAVQCKDAVIDSKTGLRVCDNGQWAVSDSNNTTVSFTCGKGDDDKKDPSPPPKSMLPVWAWVLIALGGVLLIGVVVSAVIGMTDNPLKARLAAMAPLTPISGSA